MDLRMVKIPPGEDKGRGALIRWSVSLTVLEVGQATAVISDGVRLSLPTDWFLDCVEKGDRLTSLHHHALGSFHSLPPSSSS